MVVDLWGTERRRDHFENFGAVIIIIYMEERNMI
jgi:hypothetical protein